MTTRRSQKNLTVMFTDISGFTKHTETISREALMARLDQHNELLMPIVAHFEGKIVKTIGDSFLITFESPTNAVHCGLFIQHTLLKFNLEKPEVDQIHIKISINSGEVTVTENDVFGDPVNVAAKIEKATNPDEIYFTESVFLAMNKSEVPTSFVKAFRPKGAESTEIKLYRVAMDQADERYQNVVSNTHIDKEKVKSRVLELSSLAEKEFVRYHDAIESLVDRQKKSSRGVVIAVVASALILGTAVVIGMQSAGRGGGSTEDTLAKDVRTYLQMGKPVDARGRVETYVNDEGADDMTTTLLSEIETHEVTQLAVRASQLIESGQPEDARHAITRYFGAKPVIEPAAAVLARADGYREARALIAQGDGVGAGTALTTAFADTNPSKEVAQLREQAGALQTAAEIMGDARRFEEPALLLGVISGAFGDDTKNQAALAFLEEALANELFRAAKQRGVDPATTDYEAYRKRFPRLLTWGWVESQLSMGALWHARMHSMRSSWSHSEKYWARWRQVRDYVKDKPERAYRFGCCLFMLARATNQGTCDGADFWNHALEKDPTLRERHAALGACYRISLHGDRASLGTDLKTDVTFLLGCFARNLPAMRALVATYYFDDLKDVLIAYLNSTDKDKETEQMNALAILASKDALDSVTDPVAIFRAQFDTLVTGGDRLERAHSKALFGVPIAYRDYATLRLLIDTPLAEVTNKQGRFANNTGAQKILQDMQNDLAAAQPDHTSKYDGR